MRSSTLYLLLANAMFFMVFYPLIIFYPKLMDVVALNPSLVLQGKNLWTLATSMFMHGGVFHLLANMISLMFLGGFLERLIGTKKFIGVYFVSGIVGSIFYVIISAMLGNTTVPAVGASAAIFGIAGMLAVLTPRLPVYIMFIPIAMPMWLGVIIIMFGLWLISAQFSLPIGNTAHLGGLLTGVIYALYLANKHKRKAAMIRHHFK